MKKVLYFCDRCGKEIWATNRVMLQRCIIFPITETYHTLDESVYELCSECDTEVRNFLKIKKRGKKHE